MVIAWAKKDRDGSVGPGAAREDWPAQKSESRAERIIGAV